MSPSSSLDMHQVVCIRPEFIVCGTSVAFFPGAVIPPIFGGDDMGFVAWIVLGLIAGAIAKAIMPGDDPGGIIVTILIGIVGAFLGGFLGNLVTGTGLNGFSLWSVILAILGSLLLLWIYRMTTRGRTRTTTL
jgi:uncharacterized membrane protein YeaQ/YmgE (transglycosylase-associated protein family)